MPLIALKEIPKFIRDRIQIPADLPSKRELNSELKKLIEEFFSSYELRLEENTVKNSYSDIPEWRIDTVLAKLRSLLEQDAKRKIREFCSTLPKQRRDHIQKLLHKAGIYNFRDSIELDLYVGVHTAISAYFKMIGVVLAASKELDFPVQIQNSTKELFKVLAFVATLPLRYLMAVDGIFWDSKQYVIPKNFSSKICDSDITYYIDSEEIEGRLLSVKTDEEQTGCPALRARNSAGTTVFSLVEKSCLECTQKFFLEYKI